MKSTFYIVLVGILSLAFAPNTLRAQDQSLGDAARRARREKPAPAPAEKVYDNDSLPKTGRLGYVSGNGVAESSDSAKKSDSSASSNSTSSGEGKASAKQDTSAASSGEDRKKAVDEWASKINDQKQQISQLERELSVLQRENQIRATVFYADAGARLRDEKKYAEQDRQYRDQIDAKQKEMADAKQKLDDMQEEARKAGVPASARE